MSKRTTKSELTKADETLVFACVDGDVARASAAVAAGARVDRDGLQLPLVEAARRGHTKLFRWLLMNGAPLVKAEPNGDTALFVAARGGHTAIIDVCIEIGDSVERQDESGHTPLMAAVSGGSADAVKHLLARGANPNATPHRGTTLKGTTALHVLASHRGPAFTSDAALEIFDALRGAGAEPTSRNESGQTILHTAATNELVPVSFLDAILGLGLPVDAVDAWGCTPLWCAARVDALEHVVFLLSRGADANARSTKSSALSKAGTSVYEVARERGDLRLLGALREAGAATPQGDVAPTEVDPFHVGAHVVHTKFGAGKVLASEGAGAERKLTVEFAEGNRVLQAKFVSPAS